MSEMNPVQDGGASVVIIGWLQIVKNIVPETWGRFLPIFGIILGVVYTFGFCAAGEPVGQKIVRGLITGLTASGLFSSTKNLFEKKPEAPKV